ncbi:MAG: hypothetical protein SGPRY_003544 [Prymnesium sp.]
MFDGQQALPPGEFKKIARNPCWYSQATYCLPAFLLIGVYQSGIQDLYRRLVQHEDIARRPARSPSYYSQVRPDWSDYVRGIQDCVPQAEAGKLIGEVSAVTFHFIWVHQEKFNQPYVEAMGGFWRECNARTNAQKKERRCEANFTTDQCALSFESLTRENEEVFYHCDQYAFSPGCSALRFVREV